MKKTIHGLAIAALLTPMGIAQITFEPGVDYNVGTNPDAAALGDFDGDGDLDLAVTSDNQDKVSILFNAGDGTFGAPNHIFLPASSSPHTPVAGDLNGDGDIDIAVTLKDFNSVRVLNNNGSGTFSLGLAFPVGNEPRAMAIGDVDKTLGPDLVVANRGSNSITVLINLGNSFTPTSYATGQKPGEVDFGDFTGDGLLDIAVAASDSRLIEVFENQGSGAFLTFTTLNMGQLKPEGLTAADLDGDGTIDIAATAENNNVEWAAVYLNTGGGVFGGRADYSLFGQNASSMLAADFDLDGVLDLATANSDSDDVTVLRGMGGGAFGTAQLFGVGDEPGHIVAGDLDWNKSPELVTSNGLSNDVTVMINQASCVGVFTSYCTAGTSGSGCQATVSGMGVPSAAAPNGFTVMAMGVEGQKDGLFFFGAQGRQANSWGNGTSFQCVVPPVFRGGLLFGSGTNGACDGTALQDLNARWTAKPNQNPGLGATVQLQFWYRDPMNTSSQTTSLSDALEFCVGI